MNNKWIETFENLILQGKFTEAKDCKNNYFPESLFKYRTVNQFTLDGILNSSFWAANAKTMNDPFESSITVDYDRMSKFQMSQPSFWVAKLEGYRELGITEDMIEAVRLSDDPLTAEMELLKPFVSSGFDFNAKVSALEKIARERLEELTEEQIDFYKEIVRFCSFSSKNNDTTMWSHYSNSHKGICIAYDISKTEFLKNNTYPVIYKDSPFDATPYILDKSKAIYISLIASLYKTAAWTYEEEWRFTLPNQIIQKDQAFKVSIPKAIYFGSEIGNETDATAINILSQIFDFAQKESIAMYKMKKNRSYNTLVPQIVLSKFEINKLMQ